MLAIESSGFYDEFLHAGGWRGSKTDVVGEHRIAAETLSSNLVLTGTSCEPF